MQLQKITEAWFKVPDDPDKTEFKIKNLRAGEIAKIEKATREIGFEYQPDGETELRAVPTFHIDTNKEKKLTIIAVITDWKNVFNSKGVSLECSDKNKIRLCEELSENDFNTFDKFMQESRKTLAKDIKKEEEKAKGN